MNDAILNGQLKTGKVKKLGFWADCLKWSECEGDLLSDEPTNSIDDNLDLGFANRN